MWPRSSAVVLVLALSLAGCPASGTAVTPVQKVVRLMEGMLAKGKAEKHDEQVQYAAYKQFCDDTSGEKTQAIEDAGEQITVLTANIQKSRSTAKTMAKEISGHEEDAGVWKGDQQAATKIRDIEHADYEAMHKDYTESIDAIDRAVTTLKDQSHDRKQTSLVQLDSLQSLPLIPADTKQVLSSFMQQADADLDGALPQPPQANSYEFQSQGVVDMLEKLLDEFTAERTELEKKEINANNAYKQLMQELTAEIAQANQDINDKSQAKSKALQSKAAGEGDLKDITDTKNADQTYLDDLTATCEQKSTDFASRQQLRGEELEAINKAIDIISGGSVKGAADKHLPAALLQLRTSRALASLRAEVTSAARNRVVELLRTRAEQYESRVLSVLAQRLSTGGDPFKKVQRMIQDLITRLLEQANEEAEHKGWCDNEVGTNEHTRKQKTEAVESLSAEIEQLDTSIAKLTEEIIELSDGISNLDKASAEATKLRGDEKTKNDVTVKDAQAAQTAVEQALVVLKDFYEKADDATAFVQQEANPAAPEIFDAPYKGMGSESGGVVGMLEVIESDFARLEADTKSAEVMAQKEYDSFMIDSQAGKLAKQKDIEHMESKKQDQAQALVNTKKDLDATQKELDAALVYYEKLKPSCLDAGVSYEDRVARRKEEIESLKEALQVLDGEDLA